MKLKKKLFFIIIKFKKNANTSSVFIFFITKFLNFYFKKKPTIKAAFSKINIIIPPKLFLKYKDIVSSKNSIWIFLFPLFFSK